jgi:hypothetical protein
MKHNIEIEIPEGKFCDSCPAFLEQLDSFSYEESHNWCFVTKENLNTEIPFNKKTRKPKSCPSVV